MQIKQFVVGDVATNCYLVWDEKSHEGAIVDRCSSCKRIQYHPYSGDLVSICG